MNVNFELLIVSFAIFNGFIVSILLFFKQCTARAANRYLSAGIVLYCFSLFEAVNYQNELYLTYPHSILALSPLFLALAPLLDRYGAISCQIDKPHPWRHFVPTIIGVICLFPFYLITGEEKLLLVVQPLQIEAIEENGILLFTSLLVLLINVTLVIQAPFYLWRNWKRVGLYEALLLDNFSSLERCKMTWFKILMGVLFLMWIANTYAITADIEESTFVSVVALTTSAVLIMIAIYALNHNQIFFPANELNMAQQSPKLASMNSDNESSINEDLPVNKYEHSALDSEASKDIAQLINSALIDNRLFSDTELSLEQLAKTIGLPRNYVSQVINQLMNTNFYGYINQLRIEEAQHLLEETAQSVTEIMFDVGFNSKSAFYNAFKKHTGLTPSAYRKKVA